MPRQLSTKIDRYSKKLNSFILPDSIIQKMKDKIQEAKIKDIEIGFNLCSDNSQLHDESLRTGTEYELRMPDTCSKGRKVGSFHTHVESTDPSIMDIYDTYRFGIGCIGSIEEKKIKCHIRKDKTPKQEDMEIIKSNITKFEEPLFTLVNPEKAGENYLKWILTRSELKNRYLNTIDII